MKNLKYRFVWLMYLGLASVALAQPKPDKKAIKAAEIAAMVTDQHFDFIAQYANPRGGGHKYLNSFYNVKIKKDSVVAYLPYFGEGYFDVPYNPTDGGIKFTSTDFTYKKTSRKKGGWDIVIEPKDVRYITRLSFTVFDNAAASVYFTITNKSYISFDGYIEAIKPTM